MTRPAPDPFLLPGGPVGVLLSHGFTGAPAEMRPIAETLHAAGCTVSGPLLPGHGTRWQDMNRCRWQAWADHAEASLAKLSERCDRLVVGGLSMGSLLASRIAARHPEVRGLALYSPALVLRSRLIHATAVARFVLSSFPKDPPDHGDPATEDRIWCYDVNPVGAAWQLVKLQREVRRLLPSVRCPLLVVHATGDTSIHPRSAAQTIALVGSEDVTEVLLEHSGHCLTADAERDLVARHTQDFVSRCAMPL
ncbi:MAG: alpha/beta fold hydrolase [Deltaproteobacteria bacterium]|nr:alpha/beta fold hydrolase [Deltaproteobacteria bacterium]